MRVCFVTSTYPRRAGDCIPGFVADLAEELVHGHGHEVHVVAPGDADTPSEDVIGGVRVHRFQYAWPANRQCLSYGYGMMDNLRRRPRAKFQVLGWMVALMRKTIRWAGPCDVIHAHWLEPALIGAYTKRFTGRPLVVTVHKCQSRGISRLVYPTVFGAADAVLFNSHYTRRTAARQGLRCRFGRVVYQGYPPARFDGAAREGAWRGRLGIRREAPLVLGLGRVVELKGFHVLVNSWPSVLRAIPEAKLVIAGDGPELGRVGALAGDLGVADSVRFTGAVEKSGVPALMAEADVFCNPGVVDDAGRCEALGVVTIEAMASGLACVGSRVGGIPETIRDGETGLLVRAGDERELANALVRVLKNPGLREEMGRRGRARARTLFAWPKLAAQVVETYEKVLQKQPRRE